ncbi:ArsA family ATPase [Aliidiomarina indica]|uniref:ArsA family ATPase n=1 Tax=Aliidiomarina indica TaxID=2749147 RepID=UPI00188E9686|nr:ArsA family ATPase [Aliidiomarina indica]
MTWTDFSITAQATLLSRRLLLVGGKGGVGKTTISSALALRSASLGKKTLLVSTDPAHNLGDIFDCQIGSKIQKIGEYLDALEIDPEAEQQAHLARIIGQMKQFLHPDMHREAERQLRLSTHSPGAQEAALLERICREIEHGLAHYDVVIFDTAPTGHTLRLLSLPEVMAAWTQGMLNHEKKSSELSGVLAHLSPKAGKDVDNPLGAPDTLSSAGFSDRSRGIAETLINRQRLFQRTRRLLKDAEQTALVYVLVPEKLPILETTRAVTTLREEKLPVAGLFVNRVLPETADGEFLAERRRQEAQRLAEIEQLFAAYPLYRVPLQATDIQGIEQLERVL